MKKLAVLAVAGLVLVSAPLSFPMAVAAHNVNGCFQDHQDCRENALDMDAPWYKVMLILTVCDIALGKCALGL
jgi:hypothetical protein